MKKLCMRFMSLALVAVMAMGTTAFAADDVDVSENVSEPVSSNENITPNADTVHYYSLKNKRYQSTSINVLAYIEPIWGYCSSYTTQRTRTETASLSVNATAGTFTIGPVKQAAGGAGLSVSVSRSFSVGRTFPADASRLSRLAILQEKAKYSADLYYNISTGSQVSSSYKGSGIILEPRDLYIKVVYK